VSSLQGAALSTEKRDRIPAAKEGLEPPVPRQDAIDQPTPLPHDLHGDPNEGVDEGTKLHPQHLSLLRAYRCPQRPVSGSSRAYHAFKVQAREAITMYAQLLVRSLIGARGARTPPAFELRDQVLLIAAVVGVEEEQRCRVRDASHSGSRSPGAPACSRATRSADGSPRSGCKRCPSPPCTRRGSPPGCHRHRAPRTRRSPGPAPPRRSGGRTESSRAGRRCRRRESVGRSLPPWSDRESAVCCFSAPEATPSRLFQA